MVPYLPIRAGWSAGVVVGCLVGASGMSWDELGELGEAVSMPVAGSWCLSPVCSASHPYQRISRPKMTDSSPSTMKYG